MTSARQLCLARSHLPEHLIDLIGTCTANQNEQAAVDIPVHDVTIIQDDAFHPGLPVTIQFSNGTERRGVATWREDRLAGVRLLEVLPCEQRNSVGGDCSSGGEPFRVSRQAR